MNEQGIHNLLRALGVDDAITKGEWVVSRCPLHNDSNPSFSVRVEGKGSSFFHCFGCDEGGSLTRLIHSFWISNKAYPRRAARIVAGNESMMDTDELAGVKCRFEKVRVKPEPIPDKVVKHYPLILNHCRSFEGKRCREFLNGRGISDESIDTLRVRFAADHQAVVFAHTNKYGRVFALRARSRKAKRIYSISKEVAERDTGLTLKEFPSKRDAGYWFGIHLIDWAKPVALVEGECFPSDTELLTTKGWVSFADYNGEDVLQVDSSLEGSFVRPLAIIRKEINGKLVRNTVKGFVSVTTPDHQMVALDQKGRIRKHSAEHRLSSSDRVPRAVTLNGPGIPLSNLQLRFCVAISADFAIRDCKNTGNRSPRELRYAVAGFLKERKIIRIRRILNELRLPYSDNKIKNGYQSICLSIPSWVPGRLFPHSWISQATLDQRMLILQELVHWDGNHVTNRTQTEYSCKYIENAVFVQSLAHTVGICSTIMKRSNKWGEWYKVSLLWNKSTSSWQAMKTVEIDYKGLVHCVQVPTGMILVRQEGKIHVSGNCDLLRLHTLGKPNVIASGGVGVTKAQINELEAFAYVLGYDADESGQKANERIDQMIGPSAIIVYRANWALAQVCKDGKRRPCKDAGDLPDKEALNTIFRNLTKVR